MRSTIIIRVKVTEGLCAPPHVHHSIQPWHLNCDVFLMLYIQTCISQFIFKCLRIHFCGKPPHPSEIEIWMCKKTKPSHHQGQSNSRLDLHDYLLANWEMSWTSEEVWWRRYLVFFLKHLKDVCFIGGKVIVFKNISSLLYSPNMGH